MYKTRYARAALPVGWFHSNECLRLRGKPVCFSDLYSDIQVKQIMEGRFMRTFYFIRFMTMLALSPIILLVGGVRIVIILAYEQRNNNRGSCRK